MAERTYWYLGKSPINVPYTRLDGYAGYWMRSHPDDEAILDLLAASVGCFKKEVWIWEPAEESDAD